MASVLTGEKEIFMIIELGKVSDVTRHTIVFGGADEMGTRLFG